VDNDPLAGVTLLVILLLFDVRGKEKGICFG